MVSRLRPPPPLFRALLNRLDQPLRFERVFVEKVWGGRALEICPGIELPEGPPIGETWELVDRAKENSVVAEGPFEGARFEEVMARAGDQLLGRARPNVRGRFPLLVKYLDASQALSVQVHPDDASAARIGGDAEGKTEAWYFLEVKPGGAVYSGLREGVGREDLRGAVGKPDLVPCLGHFEVQAGQSLTVEGGTVHAIGAGVTLLEVQQNSNTTYRMYDWDRLGLDGQPRESHQELALAATDFRRGSVRPTAPTEVRESDGLREAELSRTDHFSMTRLECRKGVHRDTSGQFLVYAAIAGSGTLEAPNGRSGWRMNQGDVWLLPASLGEHRIEPDEQGCTVLALDANA